MKLMVAFSSPKRSSKTMSVAAQHAKALNAELVVVRVVPDAEKVGVIAQLIESDRPAEKAQQQIDAAVAQLKSEGINASGAVRVGEVAPGIVKAAEEMNASMLFVGTMSFHPKPRFFMAKDPIVHYLVDHCPISLVLVRHDEVGEGVLTDDYGEEDSAN